MAVGTEPGALIGAPISDLIALAQNTKPDTYEEFTRHVLNRAAASSARSMSASSKGNVGFRVTLGGLIAFAALRSTVGFITAGSTPVSAITATYPDAPACPTHE